MTDDNIDLQQITDVNQLKALAYDHLVSIQQMQGNLEQINNRIAQLQQPDPVVSNGKK